jgi:glycosyltransferase involved in cell wall biosynthesis
VRLAFDARHLQTVARDRGIGRYARNLLAAWAREPPPGIEFVLLRLRNFPAPAAQILPPHVELYTRRLRRPELSMLALDPALLSVELAGRCDAYHAVQLSLPAVRRFPAVVTIHDLAPLRWPEHYLRLPHAALGHRLQYALARRAEAVIVPSLATQEDVVARLGIPLERVHVVGEAVDPSFQPPARSDAEAFVRHSFGFDGPYILYVGQFDPRKNMPALFRAFATASSREPTLRLVVAGALGKLSSLMRAALRESRAPDDRVVVTGRVDDPTLAALYAGAVALIHPALLEGFGLTPLEAMAAGTPVVAFRAPGVDEIVGDAGILVPIGDADALAAAVVHLLGDPELRQVLGARGSAHAKTFSWDRAAAETARIYRTL